MNDNGNGSDNGIDALEKLLAMALVGAIIRRASDDPNFGTWKDRVVGYYESDDESVLVSTVERRKRDGGSSYQTAVRHPDFPCYGDPDSTEAELVVVAEYQDRETAARGHEAWVTTMTGSVDNLPEELRDVGQDENTARLDEECPEWRIVRRVIDLAA